MPMHSLCISRPLMPLSKVSVGCRSLEYLFGKLPMSLFLVKFHAFIFHEQLQTADASEVRKLFFERHLIFDIQTTFRLKKPYCKILLKIQKMRTAIPMKVIKNKIKCFQLLFGRLHVLILRMCFASPIGRANKIKRPENRAL